MRNVQALTLAVTMMTTGAVSAKESIDFMFPAPVDGKLTMEMTRVIKEYNQSQNEVEVRGIFTGNYDTTKVKAEAAAKSGQPPALVIMSANFTADLAIKMKFCRWTNCSNTAMKKRPLSWSTNSGPR